MLQNEWQYLYTYDINCNLIERNIKVWEEEKWLDYDRKNFEYDDRNNLIYELFESWENDEWTTNTENNYEYDSLNVLKSFEQEAYLSWRHEHFRYEYDSIPFQYTETRFNLRVSREPIPDRIKTILYNSQNLPVVHQVESRISNFLTILEVDSIYYNDQYLPIIKQSQTFENAELVYLSLIHI